MNPTISKEICLNTSFYVTQALQLPKRSIFTTVADLTIHSNMPVLVYLTIHKSWPI